MPNQTRASAVFHQFLKIGDQEQFLFGVLSHNGFYVT